MRKYNGEYKKILNELKNATPSEVGYILKRYFSAKKQSQKPKNPTLE
ncbi:MAG: hypothetical protein IKL82_01075 [Clostridia bacterium]|nr:hypothetical protein [Clostridia bacterium]